MPNENFVPTYSTDIIYRGLDNSRCLTDELDTIEWNVSDLYNVVAAKAPMSHSHSAYAELVHEHEEYAPLNHDHYDYSMNDHTHYEFAYIGHEHTDYATKEHTHNNATTSTAGFMSAADKIKLDGIAAGASSFSTIKSISATTSGWYRIASSTASIKDCIGTFRISGYVSAAHTVALFTAGTIYGNETSTKIGVLHCSHYNTSTVTKARWVYTTAYSGQYAYVEIYVAVPTGKTVAVDIELSNDAGMSLITPIVGSIPTGYTSKEVVLNDMAWSNVTATATELNYVDGVTSNIQAQLNSKLNKAGDTMTGNLTINNASAIPAIGLIAPLDGDGKQAYSRIYKNASATVDYGLQLRDYGHGDAETNNSCVLMLCNNKDTIAEKLMFLEQVNGVNQYYKLYGEHNKPTLSALGAGDWVVEQGVSGNVYYQKWNSGKSEAWYSESLGTVDLTSALANNVWSNTSYNARGVSLPAGRFIAAPTATCNVYSNGYTFSQVASASTSQLVYRIWSPYSTTIQGCQVSIHAIGRWK